MCPRYFLILSEHCQHKQARNKGKRTQKKGGHQNSGAPSVPDCSSNTSSCASTWKTAGQLTPRGSCSRGKNIWELRLNKKKLREIQDKSCNGYYQSFNHIDNLYSHLIVTCYSNVGLGSSLRGEPGLTIFRSQGCPWKIISGLRQSDTHRGGTRASSTWQKKTIKLL